VRDCKHLDEEKIKYKPQNLNLIQKEDKKEIPVDSSEFIVLPKIKVHSENIRKKLVDFLTTVIQFNVYNHVCNARTLAEHLGVSILNIRKRMNYLQTKEILNFRKYDRVKFIEFFEKTGEKDLRYKELKASYNEYFQEKFHNTPYLEPADYVVARDFSKKTAFNPDKIRLLIKEYFALNTVFLRNSGYRLRNFPSSINSILVIRPDLITHSPNSTLKNPLSKEQLDNYIKGKESGRWTGKEDWAKEYEEEVSKLPPKEAEKDVSL